MGMSPANPHCCVYGALGLPLGITYQVPVPGLQNAKSALPSLSKSPFTGTSPGSPHCWIKGFIGLLLGITYQVLVDGRHTAKSVCLSPSKSAATGTCPGSPISGALVGTWAVGSQIAGRRKGKDKRSHAAFVVLAKVAATIVETLHRQGMFIPQRALRRLPGTAYRIQARRSAAIDMHVSPRSDIPFRPTSYRVENDPGRIRS